MTQSTISLLEKMEQAAGHSPYALSLMSELKNLEKKGFAINENNIAYLLDEKLYDTLGWLKRHEEMGMEEKAAVEKRNAEVLQRVLSVLPNQVTVTPDPGQI